MRFLENNSLGLDVVYLKLDKNYTMASGEPITNPCEAVDAVAELLKDLDREVVCMVTLKTNNEPINMNVVSVGTANTALVSPREVLKTALLSGATRIMLFHNHPSGGALPSLEDIRLTDRLKQCCDLMDIDLLDHIIIGAASREWFSFCEKKMIKPFQMHYEETVENIRLDPMETVSGSKNSPLAEPVEFVAEQNRRLRHR